MILLKTNVYISLADYLVVVGNLVLEQLLQNSGINPQRSQAATAAGGPGMA